MKDADREGGALALLRELVELVDDHPAVRQYQRLAGLVEPRLPKLEARIRAYVDAHPVPVLDVEGSVVRA